MTISSDFRDSEDRPIQNSPLLDREFSVPNNLKIEGGELCWIITLQEDYFETIQGAMSPPSATPKKATINTVFEEFLNLKSDEEILEFAKRYGILGLAQRSRSIQAEDISGQPHTGRIKFYQNMIDSNKDIDTEGARFICEYAKNRIYYHSRPQTFSQVYKEEFSERFMNFYENFPRQKLSEFNRIGDLDISIEVGETVTLYEPLGIWKFLRKLFVSILKITKVVYEREFDFENPGVIQKCDLEIQKYDLDTLHEWQKLAGVYSIDENRSCGEGEIEVASVINSLIRETNIHPAFYWDGSPGLLLVGGSADKEWLYDFALLPKLVLALTLTVFRYGNSTTLAMCIGRGCTNICFIKPSQSTQKKVYCNNCRKLEAWRLAAKKYRQKDSSEGKDRKKRKKLTPEQKESIKSEYLKHLVIHGEKDLMKFYQRLATEYGVSTSTISSHKQ